MVAKAGATGVMRMRCTHMCSIAHTHILPRGLSDLAPTYGPGGSTTTTTATTHREVRLGVVVLAIQALVAHPRHRLALLPSLSALCRAGGSGE